MDMGQIQTFCPYQDLIGVTCHSSLLYYGRTATCAFYYCFILMVYLGPVLKISSVTPWVAFSMY